MEYEKKYKDAQKWMESIYAELSHEHQMEAEAFFPELKESVDERIRKELIKGFQHYDKECKWGEFTTTEILAWIERHGETISWKPTKEQCEALDYAYNSCSVTETGNYYEGVLETLIEDLHNLEKQGEHKTDFRERYNNIAQSEWLKETNEDKSVSEEYVNPTPKFKVGDWIILDNNNNSLYQIEKIENYKYFLRHYLGGAMPLNFSDEEDLRNWTVQDVNAGDVLVCESNHGQAIGIVKDYVGKQGGCDSCFDTYCFVDWDGRFRVGGYMGSRNIHPATKEQRDTLNKVLKKEQGLVYNFAKKELTKADGIATTDKEQSDVYETRGH